jgi:multiple sugar transport system permease protein
LAFVFYWSDFLSPLLYLKSQSLYTLPVGLQQLRQLDRTNWPLLMSGAVLMTLPPVFVFLFLQRYFLRDAQWMR